MTTVRKEQIIRRKFRKNSNVTKVAFSYNNTDMNGIQVTVRYNSSPQLEATREFIEAVAYGLDYVLKNITFNRSSENYDYSIFHFKKA